MEGGRQLSRLVVVVATTLVVVLLAGGMAVGQQGQCSGGYGGPNCGQIAGTVTDACSGAPIPGISVTVYDSSGAPVASAKTGGDGTYTTTSLATGTYKVGFTSGFNGGNYAAQYYNNKATLASADPVAVTAGSITGAINAALQPGAGQGQITGTVTDASSHAAIKGISVEVFDPSGSFAGRATTASDGTYTVSSLPTGSYKVGFSSRFGFAGNYAPQYYNNKATLASADPVAVTAGSPTPGVNAAMQAGGQITGTVTDASSHVGIGKISVTAYDSSGNFAGRASTASGGTYTISALGTGSYKVEFSSRFGAGNYAPQYYNNKATLATADPVAVTAGSPTPGINAAMQPGGQITGTVTDASSHAGIANISVTAYDSSGKFVASAATASGGTYTISSLGTGSYKVEFSSLGAGNYLTQYYNNKATLASAEPVAVTAGSPTPGINAAMQAGGQITGTVTDASSHAAVANAFVAAYDSSGSFGGFATTASDGTYTISSLATGSYKVGFDGGNYLPQYYNNKATLASAEPVAVTAGSPTPGINAAMQPAGQITGTVTDASSHAAIKGIFVRVYDSTGKRVAGGRTASDGTYTTFPLLATGSYKVAFLTGSSGGNYDFQYYNSRATWASADPVAVTGGQTRSGINAAMRAPPPPCAGDQPITATATTVSATEGAGFSGEKVVSFSGDSDSPASDYSATIDWGDGSSSSSGTVVANGNGGFDVQGSHNYAEESPSGGYMVKVTITDKDTPGNTATASSTANIADAAVSSQCAVSSMSPQAFAGPTATFTDTDPNGSNPPDYSATIDWGDGSSSSGTVSQGSGQGPYNVSGSHTYASTGTFTISTTITDAGGSKTVAACKTSVFVRPATEISTSLSGGGKSGEKITVPAGTPVSDSATLSGENASKAAGKGNYMVYSDTQCSKEVASAGEVEVSGGKVPSSQVKTLAPGTYYWQASYSGDPSNRPSKSTCGAEVETVTAATATCGKTTVGKTSDSLLANVKRVNKCVLPVNATVSELSIYLSPTSRSGQQLVKGVVYADSKGKPRRLLGATTQLTFTSKSPAGWYHLSIPTPLKLAAGNYWIGMITGERQYVAAERYESVKNAEDYNTNPYASGPSNLFGSFKTTNEQMSLYATYSAG
jgi:5-hydroxyisourate hydrolase-like protein (transthyretin family)